MIKKKLDSLVGFETEYYVIELLYTDEAYKLGYVLNKTIRTKFSRKPNFQVYTDSQKAPTDYILFSHTSETPTFYDLVTEAEPKSVVNSYFILINGPVLKEQVETLIQKIVKIPEIFDAFRINFSLNTAEKRTSKQIKHHNLLNNIIESLEYHILEVGR